MTSFAKTWHPSVRFLHENGEAILVHLATGKFLKLDSAALPYISEALDSDSQPHLTGALPEDERRSLDQLLAILEENRYLVTASDTVGLNEPALTRSGCAHLMKTAYYSVSKGCNLTCRFCYAAPERRTMPYLGDTDAGLRAIDVLADLNVVNLILTGGEPLLRLDLPKLIARGKQRIRAVGITSNGTLLNRRCAERLKDAGTDFVQISMESGSREGHDALRGKGSFDSCVRAVDCLRQAGFERGQVYVTATTTRANLGKIAGLYEFADRHEVTAGVSFFQPVGRGGRNRVECTCDVEMLLSYFAGRLKSGYEECAGKGPESCSNDAQYLVPKVLLSCGMGRTTIGVEEDGSVVPCHLCFGRGGKFAIGSIYDERIGTLLDEFAARLPTVESLDACRDCNVRYFCGGGCWASCYEGDGKVSGANPYCTFFKKFYGAIVWNLGRPNEVEAICEAMRKA